MSSAKPVRLPATLHEKVWGVTDLSPWYGTADKKIGEVWFEAELPLLVKFVFTSDRLSVQVHPNDDYAAVHEHSRGKTEMWHILRAEPGAQIAIGFREPITKERMRQTALSGEIENLLQWVEVAAGDTFFIPAGTVHAIGGGLVICEIQEYSDITYRLFDYGRPRELHLDKALDVAIVDASNGRPSGLPVDCRYFHTELNQIHEMLRYPTDPARFHLLIFLFGFGTIAGEPYRRGETWLVPPGTPPFGIQPSEPTSFIRTWEP